MIEKGMNREELIEKMLDAFYEHRENWVHGINTRPFMGAALDVAVGELLGDFSALELNETSKASNTLWNSEDYSRARKLLASRRSRYLKPKSDPAVEAVRKFLNPPDAPCEWTTDFAEKLVAIVRNANNEAVKE